MRCIRLLFMGLASVYPLYWMAQFVLFFLPETLAGFCFGQPLRVVSLSYLQATSIAGSRAVFAAPWEALFSALFFSALIIGLGGDRYLSGALAIVLMGQSALLPFANYFREPSVVFGEGAVGCLLAFTLMVVGLYRILSRTGGCNFLDRLALLTLLAVLPQIVLWLAFRMAYSFFGARFLLLLLAPLYLAAIVAAALRKRIGETDFNSAPWAEILASFAVAGLLIIAITLSSRSMNGLSSDAPAGYRDAPPSAGSARLAGRGCGMLT